MKKWAVVYLFSIGIVGTFFIMNSIVVADNKVVVVPLGSSGIGSGDTKISVSPLNMTPVPGSAVNYTFSYHPGYLQLNAFTHEDEWPQLPVEVPYQIGGTALKLKELKICYEMSTASAKITQIRVNTMNDDGTVEYPLDDHATDRTSPTWHCDNIQIEPPALLSGSTSITFGVSFGNGSSTMKIGTVVLTLGP